MVHRKAIRRRFHCHCRHLNGPWDHRDHRQSAGFGLRRRRGGRLVSQRPGALGQRGRPLASRSTGAGRVGRRTGGRAHDRDQRHLHRERCRTDVLRDCAAPPWPTRTRGCAVVPGRTCDGRVLVCPKCVLRGQPCSEHPSRTRAIPAPDIAEQNRAHHLGVPLQWTCMEALLPSRPASGSRPRMVGAGGVGRRGPRPWGTRACPTTSPCRRRVRRYEPCGESSSLLEDPSMQWRGCWPSSGWSR